LDCAKTGYEVTIVEKEAQLGGKAIGWRKQLPLSLPYDSLISPVVANKIKAVEAEPKITVRTQTIVGRIAGQPGDFTVTLKNPDEKNRVRRSLPATRGDAGG
jgi:quinone-modifying oxidoreductase, subunit QmoB